MTAVLCIGGPLAIRCTTCRQPPGSGCVRVSVSGRIACSPHRARVKAAPPEQEARAGDLVVVQWGGQEAVAVLANAEPRVGVWRPFGQRWTAPRAISPVRILRLAPEDATTAAARAALAADLAA